MTSELTRGHAEGMDAVDPLRGFRDRFVIPEDRLVYFDGNSLGRPAKVTLERLRAALEEEWAGELVLGWDHWWPLARETGDALATAGVVQAEPGELIISDSTSVNLYKLAAAALAARPGRTVIVTDDDNFPTDRYVLAGLAEAAGGTMRLVKTDLEAGVSVESVRDALDESVALLSLSHVAYRSGAIADLAAITEAAHAVGALTLWDLCHSVGSVPVPLRDAGVDLAVGCTYKHLNAGPGAPAFLYVRRELQRELRQPIQGWYGSRDPFAMGPDYEPADSVARFHAGTPSVLGCYAVQSSLSLFAEAGLDAVRAKGKSLTSYVVALADAWLEPHGFRLASPRSAERRGAHVTFHHPRAFQISQALRAVGVVPDFRTPSQLRFGLAPLYTRFTEVYEGFDRLRRVMESEAYLTYPAEPDGVT